MNRAQIVKKMAELAGGTQVEGEKWLEAFLGTMKYCAENHEKMNLVGYFSMEVVDTAERVGRNPQKPQETFIIPAGKTLKIKVSKKLKELV